MAHQLQLEKEKYRQWVKAGLGLGYLKEGLVPFCNDIADQQHKDILQNIRSIKSLPSTVTCGGCQVETLKPDHKPVPGNAGNKVCPLGQVKCSCCCKGKIACPNNICGAIYDFIVQHHASTPPAPNWKNSDALQWVTDPWSICKCFINAPGYEQKQSACETDCTGLLILMINNQYFHSHIGCNVTGTNNLFSKVRQYRNAIFHSSSMELEESEANTYLDDMIAVLQDGKELLQRSDSQIAVKKLQDLKNKDFIITTESFEEILRQIKEEMAKVLKSTESAATKEEHDDLKNKLLDLETKVSKVNDENLENAELKKKLVVLETLVSEQKEEMAKINTVTSSGQSQAEYEQTKLGCRTQLIEHYRSDVLKVSAIPLQPDEENYNFSDVYIRPTITNKIEKNRGESEEKEIESMSEIFTKSGEPQKFIYVIGDAGSGKSSFCKYLINCWCMAHSDRHNEDDEFEGVKEMKKFDFMFYISLRHNIKIRSIQEMLEMRYDKIKNLSKLLENDSEKIIILLDGLDEWSFDSETRNEFQAGLPERDFTKKYTIVTTSRPWKIHSLRVSNREIHQLLKLKGFDETHEEEMIKKIITALNKSLDPNVCEQKLNVQFLVGLKQVPIMLQQLVCLWCDVDIQKLMFESMEEFNATCSIGSNTVFYIGDLVIDDSDDCDIVCSSIDQQQIVPDSVLSINVVYINTKNVKFTKYLLKFHHLEKIAIRYESESQWLFSTQSDSTQSNERRIDEINNCVSETIKVNTSTLKSLSLDVYHIDKYYPVCKTVVSNLPSMIDLVAIRMSGITMSHVILLHFVIFLREPVILNKYILFI
ncbi:uncharacterized protein LOC132759454 [Ruditapes philippinarum]|uniref:uncharacterized protein LOC132759454 n=1 Tax=Ruditapes philippinarum TaxID=129788 RepID=UPI00295AD666|nr:uncharacterized protein LOC132759454 [Ruditapes philippinarum]